MKACQKAKRTIAYQAGYKYAVMGLSWLSSEAWERQYDLSLQLHNFAAEFAWLCGDLDAMNGYIETILQQSQSLLDKISAFCLQIQADTSQMKFVEALTTAQQVLEFLGVALPSSATRDHLLGMVSDIELMIADISIAGLANLPVMTIPSDIAIIQIISHIIPTAYICGSHLFPVTVILGVKLLIRAGNSPLSAYIYANYAYILCNYCQSIEKSEEFGQLALRLANETDAKSVRPQVYVMLALYMQHRKSPLRETLDLAQQGYIFAQEVGNQEWAGYSAYAFCANGFASVQNLIELEEMTHNYCVSLVKSNQIASANWCQIYRQAILNLTNPSPQQQTIFFDNLDQEANFLAELHKAEDLLGLYHFHLCKLIISYLFGDIEVAHQHALEARARLNVAQGIVGLPVFYFYDSLVLLCQLTKINPGSEEGVKKLQQVESNQNKLQQDWANYAPVNYQHKFDLVQAEKLGILGERWAALELYDEAIAGAKTHDYFQEEALANELAAKFYLAWGKDKVAAGYMQDAYYGYLRWSAKAKTNSLEQQYPHLLQAILRKSHSTDSLQTLESISEINLSIHSSVTSTAINTNSQLDFAAVLKATQLLSEQIQLNELLTQLVQLMLQNSGADKLAVILPDGGNTWQVRAIATPEMTQLLDESSTDYPHLPIQLIQYAKNTREIIAIDDLHTDLPIIDAYLQEHQPRSILCLPILYQGDLTGLLYLQNQAIAGVFSRDRILVLNFLCTQAAIALENARLFKEQQRSAVEIQIKNNFLKAQQESSLDGMLVIDANRQVSAYNQRFVSIWNIPKAVLETQDDQQLLAYVLDQLENPTEFLERVEYLYNHPKECSCDEIALKNQRFLERYSSPVRLPWGEYSSRIWYFRDISDRKQLEQEQARLTAVLEATPDFIGVANTQGEILWHNKPLRELRQDLGNPKDYRSIASCHPDWANKIIREEALPTAIQHGSWSGELALLDGAGTEIPVSQVIIAHKSASGEVVNYSTIMRDIRDRKAAEQELTLKQNHLEALLNNIPHIAWIKDAESRFIAVNQPLAQMLNCSPTDMIGKTDYDFSPAAIARGYQQDDFQVLTSGQRKIVEERTRRGDGSWGWLETTKTPFRDAQGRLAGTVGIAADISNRKAAEKLLKMTQYGVHNSSDGIIWVTVDARIIYANPAICKLLGYSEEELTALSVFDIDPDFPPENWESAWEVTKAGQDGCILESRHRTKDGRLCPVEIVGNYFELDGIEYEFVRIRDISDRKQAERLLADYSCELERQVEERTRALQESQHELTDYIENAATSLHWVDANGIILWANQTELDFLGYSREEYIGQPIANFHADDEVIADILTRLSNNETLTNYEARLRCKDGSIRYVQISSNVFYRDGEFVHTRCFTTDITERKAAETALNDLVAGTAATTGEDFFPALVCHISTALEVPITLVTQFVDQELQSLAFVVDGELQPNFTYNLPETPCRDLVVDYSYHCPSNLSEHFPNHPHRARGVDSYLGVALRDRQGQVLGSLCIFDRQSLRAPEKARQILDVFGSRAAAELERQRTEKALQNLIAGTAAFTGPDFFNALVRHIAEALNASYAFVNEVIDSDHTRILAAWADGEYLPEEIVEATDTPCAIVLQEGSYYCGRDLGTQFPHHPLIASMGVESYQGIVLPDRQGQTIGMLCVLARQPMVDPDRSEQILRVFAARAAAELERQRAANALQNLIAGTAALTGPDFFNALVCHIAEALNASHAFVTEVVEANQLRFLAAWGDGQHLPTDVVDIEGTTCAIALQEGAYHCKRNVIAGFPQNPRLAPMGVESYMGVALQNRQGRSLGTLCIFSRQLIANPEHSQEILRVFAARAAAELERQQAEMVINQQFAAIEAAIDGISILQNGVYRYVNQAHLNLFGYQHADELVGQSWKRLYSPDEVSRFEQDILPLLAYEQGWQGEAIATRQDGSTFAQGVSLTLTEDGLLISVCRDISDLKQAQSLITHNALHDPLTGLPNRTLLLERLALAIQRAQRYENYRYAVLFLDLDRFKVINDSLGHVVGDQLLVAIAQRLKTHLRQTDLVARLGGDEFLILLEDISHTEEVAQIAGRILDDCQTPLNINGHQIFISTSIGIVLSEKDYQQATDLIRDADIAMYQAKTDGRNSYRFFDTEMHTEVLKRLILETDLRKAVDQQEFEIYYQPIIELSNRQLIGFEALVRWRHPTRDLIAPDEFIPVAEETGFIQLIDSWVLQQACQQIVDWQNRFPEFAALKISINLSAQDLGKANLIEEIDRVLANTGLRGESITLEITESLLIQDIDKIIDLFMQLTQRKIQISIDDFGTGYSSLSYLHRLPVHSLKVDRSFVSQMESKTRNYKVVSTIVGLGQQLGLTTIAEGIEAPQQLSLVQKLGCQFGQGYLFSPPLSTQDVEVFFSQGKDALGSY
ncbi:MAG: EAL domain-containing protein [Cyanobacteria bacterium P01_F01_bin.86]